MPRGGARKGAGRKKGDALPEIKNRLPYILDEQTRLRLKQIMPFDVMVEAMARHMAAVAVMDELDMESIYVDGKLVTKLSILKTAADIADKAAPYVHRKKPAEVEMSGKDGGPINHHITVEVVGDESPHTS